MLAQWKNFNLSKDNYRKYSWILFFVSIVLIGLGKFFHEPWMDECRNLSVNLEAKSISELYQLRSYESHPMLYYVLMYTIKSFGFKGMIVLHYLAAIAVSYLLIFKSQFSILVKSALVFSYYFIYEITVFNRQYVFVLLLIFLLLVIIQSKNKSWLAYLIVTTLLVHLHLFAWLLIFPISIYFFFHVKKEATNLLRFTALAFIALQVGLALYTSLPPADSSNHFIIGPLTMEHFQHWCRYFVYGFLVCLNVLKPSSFAVYTDISVIYGVAFCILLLTILSIKDTFLKIYYVLTLAAVALFCYHFWAMAARHTGFYFYTYLFFLWLDQKGDSSKKNWQRYNPIFYVIIFYQFLATLNYYIRDIREPYSQAHNVAQYIRANYTKDIPVASYFIFAIDAPAAELGRPVFALHEGRYRNYYSQRAGDCNLSTCDLECLLANLRQFQKLPGNGVVLLSIDAEVNKLKDYLMAHQLEEKVRFVKAFDGAIEPRENYYLLEVE